VRALGAILRRHRSRIASILDVGCGDGFVGESLRAMLGASVLVGVDVHLPAAECGVSHHAGYVVERYAAAHLVGERRFDLVLALDVIEHVTDERALIDQAITRRTTRGGLVLVTAPAFQGLFSDHDRALQHFRRYNSVQLQRVLSAAGLDVVDKGYLFASLLPPRAIAVAGERLGRHRADHGIGSWQGPSWLGRVISAALTLDAAFLFAAGRLGIRIPGLTAWALCTAR